jgi:hypothetical protein
VTTIEILAVIGGITVIITAAAKIPAALAGLIRACIPVADAVRELRAAITGTTLRNQTTLASRKKASTQESGRP